MKTLGYRASPQPPETVSNSHKGIDERQPEERDLAVGARHVGILDGILDAWSSISMVAKD